MATIRERRERGRYISVVEAEQWKFSRSIDSLVRAQQNDSDVALFRGYENPGDLSALFATYPLTQRYGERVMERLQDEDNDPDHPFLEKATRGRLFQDMSYFIQAVAAERNGLVLLSPERTVAAMQIMFPVRKLVSSHMSSESLEDLPVPDGLFVSWDRNDGIWRIVGAAEYTTALGIENNDHADRTTEGLNVLKRMTRDRQLFPENMSLVWTEPKNLAHQQRPIQVTYPGVDLRFMDMEEVQLSHFISNRLLPAVRAKREELHPSAPHVQHRPWAGRRVG